VFNRVRDKIPVTRDSLTQMESDESSPDREHTRDRTRVLLVACCLLALGLAGILVPTVTGGVVDSPAEELVPGEAIGEEATENLGPLSDSGLGDIRPGDLQGQNGTAGQLGALNPGDSTQVGGPTGVDGSAFDSQSTAEHFTVRSSRPAYWRTGAYDEYTGSGWERNGGAEPLRGDVETEGIEGPRVEYEVELNRSASAVPTVFQPSTVEGVDNLALTDQRAVRAGEPLPEGTAYSGVSYQPPQDPAALRTSGDDYPRGVETRYTQLPRDTPGRLETFTDDLTADADSPYEKAVAIETWLESEKEYSLDAERTSGHMADTFVFEMEAGYCEYFATSMVAMLRTQDIPARYVVGYSTGQQVGENTYQVRGMNAHAWVEVYFEDVGWVKFDPTPGSARLQAEQQSVEDEQPDADYSPTEDGSPGETFSPEGENTDEQGSDPTDGNTSDGPDGETESGYQVSLNRTAVPGADVAVTVTQGGELQSGVTVLFDGEPVGQTDEDGTVVGTVPYTDQFEITVADRSGGGATAAALPTPQTLPGGTDDRLYSGGGVAAGSSSGADATAQPLVTGDTGAPADALASGADSVATVGPDAANLTVPVETNVSVTVTGDATPGETVTVTGTVDGVPVQNATVLLGGTEVNTTDENGRAAVTLPDEGGNVTVAIERGEISGETTLSLPVLSVEVTPTAPLALPGTEAVVNVTADGDSVAGAPVFVDGEQVATTGVNGTATITLPFAGSATVRATNGAASSEATVRNLYVNLGGVVGGLLTAVVALFALARRYGYSPQDVLAGVWSLPGRVVQYGQWVLVTVATRWDDLLAIAAARLRRTAAHLRALLDGRTTLGELRLALLAWLDGKRGSPVAEGEAESVATEERYTIRRAWRQFLGYLSVGRPETKTPGELARHAVTRDDLPARPVQVLRDTFREVEYGARSAEQRIERVQQAVADIESDRHEEDEESGER